MPHGTGMPSTTVPATFGSGAAEDVGRGVPLGVGGAVDDAVGVCVGVGVRGGVGDDDAVPGLPSWPTGSSALHAATAARPTAAPPMSRVERRSRTVIGGQDGVAAPGRATGCPRSWRGGPGAG